VKRGWFGSLKALTAFSLSGIFLAGGAAVALAQAQTFAVRLDSFVILDAPAQVRAGSPITFNMVNIDGQRPHNLAIDLGGGRILSPDVPNVPAGGRGTVTFAALQPGTYTLFCPVGTHRQQGMETRLTVVAAAPAAPSGAPVRLPATGDAAGMGTLAALSRVALPAGLAALGLAAGAAGLYLRRRAA
jgi:plastocyanin